MASVNKVILIGNLGQDPELRYTESGAAVVNLSLAVNESWNDRESGERVERVTWVRVVAWNRLAESCAQYLTKGRSIFVEGKLETNEWETREGEKKKTTQVRALNIQFLGGKPGQGQQARRGRQESQPPPDDDGIPF